MILEVNKQCIGNNLENSCLLNIHELIMISLNLFNILQLLQFLLMAVEIIYFKCSIVISQSM